MTHSYSGSQKQPIQLTSLPTNNKRTTTLLLLFALEVVMTLDRPLVYDVEEERPPGVVVVADIARDAGLTSRYPAEVLRLISYSIIGQQKQGREYFQLDDGGTLRTAKRIDREATCRQQWRCVVRLDVAVHPPKYFEIVKLELNVTDINDNAPTFAQNRLILSLPESTQPKELVPIIPAADLDSPPNGIVGYRLQDSSGRFDLRIRNRTAGAGAGESAAAADLRLVLLQPLDREQQDTLFQMQILAFDGGTPALTGTLGIDVDVVDVNDNSPTFENTSYSVAIHENLPAGSTLLRVRALDPDAGINGRVRYQFSRRSQAVNGAVFAIDAVSGAVVLLQAAKDLALPVYRLAVIAEDQGDNSVPSTTSVTVTVHGGGGGGGGNNEHRPVITIDTHAGERQGTWRGEDGKREKTREMARNDNDDDEEEGDGVVNVEVAEHGSPNASLATVSVTDADRGANGRVTCSLNGDTASPFAIVSLFEAEYKIVATRSLDRSRQRQHRLSIRCRDFGHPVPLAAVRNLTVTVTAATDASSDELPVFSAVSYNASIRENNVQNQAVVSVFASVKSNGARIRYSLDHDAAGMRF